MQELNFWEICESSTLLKRDNILFLWSSTTNAADENGTPGNDSGTKHKNTLDLGDEGNGSTGSCSTRLSRSRSRRQKRNRRNQAIPGSSGGPCHSHPRPQTVAWTNDALASLVMFHAHCMMNPMHLRIPKTPCKWFPLPDDYNQYYLLIYGVCHD